MKLDRRDPAGRVAAAHRDGTGARVPYPVHVRTVRIGRIERLTPGMLRLTLVGPELDGMHTYQCDDHVKIVFPDVDGTLRPPVPNEQQALDWPRPLPRSRKYTIRRYDADLRELDLDVVAHVGGLAADWALAAQPGEAVTIAGPPGAITFPQNADHYVFAVDLTALPAAARWLEESPPDVSADIIIDAADPADAQYPLAHRDGVRVHWLSAGDRSTLSAAVEALDLPAGRVFLFAAGEADDIRPLRRWGTDRLVTGYWKRGAAEGEASLD